MENPNCVKCKFRQAIPGDHHSKCIHPQALDQLENPFGELLAIFASVGRVAPTNFVSAKAVSLGIKADPHGISNGWFCWPYNFDPVWLKNCNGFEEKECKS